MGLTTAELNSLQLTGHIETTEWTDHYTNFNFWKKNEFKILFLLQ